MEFHLDRFLYCYWGELVDLTWAYLTLFAFVLLLNVWACFWFGQVVYLDQAGARCILWGNVYRTRRTPESSRRQVYIHYRQATMLWFVCYIDCSRSKVFHGRYLPLGGASWWNSSLMVIDYRSKYENLGQELVSYLQQLSRTPSYQHTSEQGKSIPLWNSAQSNYGVANMHSCWTKSHVWLTRPQSSPCLLILVRCSLSTGCV